MGGKTVGASPPPPQSSPSSGGGGESFANSISYLEDITRTLSSRGEHTSPSQPLEGEGEDGGERGEEIGWVYWPGRRGGVLGRVAPARSSSRS